MRLPSRLSGWLFEPVPLARVAVLRLLVFAFVGIQMGWVLRPFIGHPRGRTTFFREGAWGNAYVEVAKMVRQVVGG